MLVQVMIIVFCAKCMISYILFLFEYIVAFADRYTGYVCVCVCVYEGYAG